MVEGLQINFKAGCQEGIPWKKIFQTKRIYIFFLVRILFLFGGGKGLEGRILLLSLLGVTEQHYKLKKWTGWTLHRGKGPTEEIQ